MAADGTDNTTASFTKPAPETHVHLTQAPPKRIEKPKPSEKDPAEVTNDTAAKRLAPAPETMIGMRTAP